MRLAARIATYACDSLLIATLFGLLNTTIAAELKPLRAADTSSPRATLQSFMTIVDESYRGVTDVIRSYAASERLYLSTDERRQQLDSLHNASKAIRCLDLSGIPDALQQLVSVERALQLKEILDRIEVPTFENIPDRIVMVEGSIKRWRLPDTEIDFVLIEEGPRAGEYLIDAHTLERLPDFHERVKHLPYKAGAAKDLRDTYHSLSSGRIGTIYEGYLTSPAALAGIIPPRWMLSLPSWARTPWADLTAWQWLGLALGLIVSALLLWAARRGGRDRVSGDEDLAGTRGRSLLTPLAILVATGLLLPAVAAVFHIGGSPRIVLEYVIDIAFFLGAAWLAVIGCNILGERIAASRHLQRRSLDDQLTRLAMRFVGIVIAVGLLIEGANELGFPAYSVVAGLGVGGLAVALAARDNLANLFASILIVFERPFRIGHLIKVGGCEGIVEDVGFRSTRIRTFDNSLVSIPNNAVVNATVENLSLRAMRRQRFFVQVTYDTPRKKVEDFIAGIKQLIADHPKTDKNNLHVRFNGFGESGLNVLVYFYLRVPDYVAEIKEREGLLLQIMDLAKAVGVEFAFPTRSVRVETLPAMSKSDSISPVS